MTVQQYMPSSPLLLLRGSSKQQQLSHDDPDQAHHRHVNDAYHVTSSCSSTAAERKEARASKTKTKTGLQDLPAELLYKIKEHLVDLTEHATYCALCEQTQALYSDTEFRSRCLRASIGRPALWKHKSWQSIARSVTDHLAKCRICHRYMSDGHLTGSELEGANQVYDRANDAPWIAVISNLRQCAGRYSIDWSKKRVLDRPELILASLSPDQEVPPDPTDVRLVDHVAMAARLAFIQPIRRVKCGFESDSVWQFGKATPLKVDDETYDSIGDPGKNGAISQHDTTSNIATYHELNARAVLAEEYRKDCYNIDGITVLDLLLAASDTPAIPTDGLTGQTLLFGGMLDDTLRGQNTIWVHAAARLEDLDAGPQYAPDHAPSSSLDFGRVVRSGNNDCLCDPHAHCCGRQAGGYGYEMEEQSPLWLY